MIKEQGKTDEQPPVTTVDDGSKLSPELEAKYNEVFAEPGKKKQDEAYLPPDEDEEVDKPEKAEEEELEEEPEEGTKDVTKDVTDKKKEDEEEDIPERLVLAGRSAGFADAKIIKLAEESPEVLEALASYRDQLITKPQPQPQPTVVQKKEEKLGPIQIDLVGIEDEQTRKLIETLVTGQNQLIDKYNKTSEELDDIRSRGDTLEQKAQADFNLLIDNVLDEESKNCPVLGQAQTLTPKAKETRSEVFDIALVFNKKGKPIEQSLRDAVKAYNGLYANSELKAEDSLRTKLNQQKKRFTARPGGKKTERQYKNADDKAMDAMVEKGREIGFDW